MNAMGRISPFQKSDSPIYPELVAIFSCLTQRKKIINIPSVKQDHDATQWIVNRRTEGNKYEIKGGKLIYE